MKYPITKIDDVVELLHGHSVYDPYRWLEDIDNSEVKAWLEKQNKVTREVIDKLPFKQQLKEEFEKLYKEESIGMPYPKNGRYFFMKRKESEDLPVLYVKEGLYGQTRALVDPNKLSKEKKYPISFSNYSVSKDAKYITYTLSETSNDKNTLYVMDVDSGINLGDQISGESYPSTGSFSVDNSGFWYTKRKNNAPKGEEKFHRKVYFHKLGSSETEDTLVFGENLAKQDIASAVATSDGKFLIVTVHISSEPQRRTEIFLLNLDLPEKGFMPVVSNIKDDQDTYFYATKHRDHLYIRHNYKSPKWKLERVKIDEIEKGIAGWETIIKETDDVLEDIDLIKDKLFVLTSKNVHSVLNQYTLTGDFVREIKLPGLGTSNGIIGEPEGEEGFFRFNSFNYPHTIFRIDFANDEISIYDQQKIAVDVSDIAVKQEWYKSKDGINIPMFIVHKKNFNLDGNNPTVLYGYGGFNVSLYPEFNKAIIPFVKRGGVYAVANLRGGGEFGEAWHSAGTKKQKQNTFDDFICACEWLIENKYTNSNKLAIKGESNGGLLVGAVMNQRPELMKAVIMGVPVADMLRFHLFHGGRHWFPDWGSPEDPEMFPYLLSYSPYHNVKTGVKYPATIIVTADQDDRVHPGQAFKMLAILQKNNVSDNPILLRVERNAGHGGAADISRLINKLTDQWSFIFWQLHIEI
jgi:prolyl oligopeptidase